MRLAEIGWHEVGIVQIGEGGVGIVGAGIEQGLYKRLQFGFARAIHMEARRQREGVVHDPDGVHVIALHPTSYGTHPGHMHGRGKQGEICKRCMKQKAKLLAGNLGGSKPANRYVLAPLGTDMRYDQKWGTGEYVHVIKRRCRRQL